jgi:hypothetical protein
MSELDSRKAIADLEELLCLTAVPPLAADLTSNEQQELCVLCVFVVSVTCGTLFRDAPLVHVEGAAEGGGAQADLAVQVGSAGAEQREVGRQVQARSVPSSG